MRRVKRVLEEIRKYYTSEEYQRAYRESIIETQRYGYGYGCYC